MDTNYHILLVEDDKYFRMGIKDVLMKHGITLEAETPERAREILKDQKIDLAIVDIHLGDDPLGLEVLAKTRELSIPSIVLSSSEDDEITEKAYELGCSHFLAKRHYRKHLDSYVRQLLKASGKNSLDGFFQQSFITQDLDIIKQIKQLSQMNLAGKSIFIGGETGVGKSLIGKLIHQLNFDSNAPFVHLNCSEVPENLIEAELFGHKKGAFTGADKDRPGRLKLADGGVLFLDEIATMPMLMQQKLLKALDEKTFFPVGASKMESSNFTLVSATCEDLFEKVHNHQFRKDLFFRISGLNIEIKPLRKRNGDINLLIEYLLKKSPRRIVIKQAAMEALQGYSWPGNARELIKTCELLTLKSQGVVDLADLPDHILVNAKNSEMERNPLLTDSQKAFIQENGLKEFIKILEKLVVQETLEANQGKIAQTIKDLKISSSAFYRIYDTLK